MRKENLIELNKLAEKYALGGMHTDHPLFDLIKDVYIPYEEDVFVIDDWGILLSVETCEWRIVEITLSVFADDGETQRHFEEEELYDLESMLTIILNNGHCGYNEDKDNEEHLIRTGY